MNFRDTTTKRRSESIASNRPKSRGLHPVGALARIHRKKSLPIGGRQERKARHKDPNRLRTIGPNLRDYTQWVRLRAPTGRKVSRLEEGQKEKRSIKDSNRLRTIGPNLGDYTQWVRLRAPTGRKVSRLEEGQKEKQSIKDPNRLRTIGPNLGDYTQWVRLRAPTGSKFSDWRRAEELTLWRRSSRWKS